MMYNINMKRYFLIFSMALFLLISSFAHAQVTAVSLNVTPDNADVGDIVTVSASSYTEDMSRSVFTWTANGKVIKKGAGVSSISFKKRGDVPTVTIGVSIDLKSGETIEQSVDISNQSVDLLWETVSSYTPPFYKGKSLPIQESAVRFSQIVSRGYLFGSKGNKNNIYTWSRGNSVVGSVSGTGKDSFPIIMDYMVDKEQIGVKVESIANTSITSSDIDLKPFDPKLVFYKMDSNKYIDWNNALSDGYSPTGQLKIFAAPYYITPKNLSDVTFNWSQNDQSDSSGQVFTVFPNGDGQTTFSVDVENTKTFFQSIKKDLLLNI